jgi:hypothetical protein
MGGKARAASMSARFRPLRRRQARCRKAP